MDCKSDGYKEFNGTTGMWQENLEMTDELDWGAGMKNEEDFDVDFDF